MPKLHSTVPNQISYKFTMAMKSSYSEHEQEPRSRHSIDRTLLTCQMTLSFIDTAVSFHEKCNHFSFYKNMSLFQTHLLLCCRKEISFKFLQKHVTFSDTHLLLCCRKEISLQFLQKHGTFSDTHLLLCCRKEI